MSEERKESWLQKHGYWFLRVATAVIVCLMMLVPSYWVAPLYGARVERAQKERKISSFTIDTPKGQILVTELRSGTEFNRILRMPNGKVIAEAGWVNH